MFVVPRCWIIDALFGLKCARKDEWSSRVSRWWYREWRPALDASRRVEGRLAGQVVAQDHFKVRVIGRQSTAHRPHTRSDRSLQIL